MKFNGVDIPDGSTVKVSLAPTHIWYSDFPNGVTIKIGINDGTAIGGWTAERGISSKMPGFIALSDDGDLDFAGEILSVVNS